MLDYVLCRKVNTLTQVATILFFEPFKY